jgi:formylglycine-generating enzyme required for sulfatase activity
MSEPAGMVALDGGTFLMGASSGPGYPADGEFARPVQVTAFDIDPVAVTNSGFETFVNATGYTTDAEQFGWSFVFAGLLPDDFPPTAGIAAAPWWRQVERASWLHPEGPGSTIDHRLDHPVVHVSLNDALAYCRWRGVRLATEAEWEFAARGGLHGRTFPWGDEIQPDGGHRMNVWQGEFPSRNTLDDGYYGTAPVDAYEPNAYGLFNATGNVWEWTAEGVQKGGSYLCHASHCRRYRVAARQQPTGDSSAGNAGFRVCGGAPPDADGM